MRAIHRLHRKLVPFTRCDAEEVILKFVPMTALFVQLPLRDVRYLNFFISVLLPQFPHKIVKKVAKSRSLRRPERESGANEVGEGKKVKLSAAWLVEHAGFKGVHDKETGMATWDKQCLVLVNENAHSSDQLIAFRDKIIGAVKQKFGITLVQEPELLGD